MPPHAQTCYPGQLRSGVTILELLVVVVIVLALTAAAIPVMLPALEGRRVREAARQVNVFLAGARSRAMQTGRPVGVLIESLPGLPEAAVTLSYAAVPPPYAGETTNSRMVITSNPQSGTAQVTRIGPYDPQVGQVTSDEFGWTGLVRLRDQIKLNYQGRLYTIIGGMTQPGTDILSDCTPQNPWTIAAADGPPPASSPGVQFQIIRQPVKSAAAALQLPETVAIDMNFSGDAYKPFCPRADLTDPFSISQTVAAPVQNSSQAVVVFSPTGVVDHVYSLTALGSPATWTWAAQPAQGVGLIYLLIGKRDHIPLARPTDNQENFRDPTNLWVTVNPQTGLVTTAENTAIDNTSAMAFSVQNQLRVARTLASRQQSMGGR